MLQISQKKHMYRILFLNKVAGFMSATVYKKKEIPLWATASKLSIFQIYIS